ncbi:MAG: hypothetical protein ACKPKO_61315, partial [Candidatus Fonsibacter sp.]
MQKLSSNASAKNGEASPVDFLSKYIFAQDMKRIENMSKALTLCETAVNTIALIKFHDNYMSTSGRLSWESYKEKLAQAPTFPRLQWNQFHWGNGIEPIGPMELMLKPL